MQEAVKAEILKLLDNGIIYPISDSQCVSPVHAVLKKSGFTIVENENKELVQTRLPMKIRVCIDYRKLNAATRKDHFLLPFIVKCLNVWRVTSVTVSWTVTRGITRSLLLLRTKKRLRSHVHLGHLLIVECLSAYAMPQQCFNVAC